MTSKKTTAAAKGQRGMSIAKKSVICAACVALCVVLPMGFHAFPRGGEIYDPMWFPVMICALSSGWWYGLICGVLGPVLSTLVTGMPPVAELPTMIIQGIFLGVVCGLMMFWVHTHSTYGDLYISIVVGIIIGSAAAGCAKAWIFDHGKYSFYAWILGYFFFCLPGLIIQLAAVPSIVVALMKGKLIPERYPSKHKEKQVEAQ